MTFIEQDSRSRVSDTSLLEALAIANKFTQEDLELNRAGQFSRSQKKRLLKKSLLFWGSFLAMLMLVFWPLRGELGELQIGQFLFYLLIFAVLFFGFGWIAVTILVDLWNGRVLSTQGPVVRIKERSRYGLSHYYLVNAQRFHVSRSAYDALVELVHYRIHYAPHSSELVSIEPVRSARERR